MKKNCFSIFSLWKKYKIFFYLNLSVILMLAFTLELSAAGSGDGKSISTDNPQQIKVKGQVIDASTKTPLPGVNVIVQGTTIGTVSDANGGFTLDVPKSNAVLKLSFIGYKDALIELAGKTSVSVELIPSEEALGEVVVVGYGSQLKKDVTGSVTTISAKKLLDKPVFNVGQSLQGKVAGVKIIEVSGEPGQPVNMRIRGTNSINSSNDPLYVVDGIVGMANAVTNMNPNIIQSIEVLKDASATAIYGARGANGVVIITTKRGIAGKTTVEYNGYVSIGTDQRRLHTLTADQLMYVYMQAWATEEKGLEQPTRTRDFRGPTATGLSWSEMPYLFEKTSGKGAYMFDLVGKDGNYYKPRFNTDWWKESYQTAVSYNHQLNVRGGTDNAKFGLFLGNISEQGLLKKTDFIRNSAKFTADLKPFKWLDVNASLNYLRGTQNLSDIGTMARFPLEVWSILPVKYPNDPAIYGNYAGKWSGNQDFPLDDVFQNPTAYNDMLYNKRTLDQITADIGLNFKITKDLSFKATAAIDDNWNKQNTQQGRDSQGSGYIGSAAISTYRSFYWQNEDYFNYVKQIGDHSITGLLGLSWQRFTSESFSGSNNRFFDDFYGWHNIAVGTAPQPSIGSSDNQTSLNSYYGRINYGYKSKYLVTVTGRYDGSSKFGKNSKYGFFPSGSLAWVVSQEKFIKDISQISNLKLRASYGKTGNQEIGSYVTQTFLSSTQIVFDGQAQPGLYPSSFGNADLKWETTAQYDGGIDLGLFNGRINLTFDLYHKLTSDMLLDVPLPYSTTVGTVKRNYGEVENKGVEFFISTENIKGKDFTWTTELTISHNKNIIKKLGPTGADIYDNWWLGLSSPATVLRVGQSIGSMFATTRLGTWSTMETSQAARYGLQTGDLKWQDVNNDGNFTIADAHIVGTPFPKVEADMNNTFTYKGFDFNIEYRAALGFYHNNWTYLVAEDQQLCGGGLNAILDGWTPYHQNTIRQMVRSPYGGWGNSLTFDTHWVQDASFLRGEGMTLGYTLPESVVGKLRMQSVRVYLNAKNFSIYAPKCLSLDPEGGTSLYGGPGNLIPGQDFYTYPRPSTYSFGINVIF
jgi:TonB-linked SusC/RagA family outer membrane protein